MKIDPKKLLPPSDSSIQSLTQGGLIKAEYFLVPSEDIRFKTKVDVNPKSLENVDENKEKETKGDDELKKELLIIKKTVINIEDLLKDSLILQKKRDEDLRKLREDAARKAKETKLEAKPEYTKTLKKSKLPMPKLGFLDMIIRFIQGVLLGYAIEKLWKYLPLIAQFAKLITPVTKIIETIAGALFNALVNFIDAGYTAYDKVRDFTKTIGGESFQKTFDQFSGVLNTLITTAIAIAIATSGGSDFGLGDLLDPKKGKKGIKGPQSRPRGVTKGKGGQKPGFFDRFREKPKVTGGKPSFLERLGGLKDRLNPFAQKGSSKVTMGRGGAKPSYIDRVVDIFRSKPKVTGAKPQGLFGGIAEKLTKAKGLGIDIAKDTQNILDIDKLKGGLDWGRTKAANIGSSIVSAVKTKGSEILEWTGKNLSGLGKDIFEFVGSKYKQAADFGRRIGKGISNIAEIAKQGPNALANLARTKIESTIKPLIQNEGPVKTIFDSIKNAVKNPKEVAKGLGGLIKNLVKKPEIKSTRDLLRQVKTQYKIPFIDKAIAAIVGVLDYATGTPLINAILSSVGGLLGWGAGFAIGAPFGGVPGFFTGTAGAIAGEFIASQLANLLAKTPLANISDPLFPDRKLVRSDSEEKKPEDAKSKPPEVKTTKPKPPEEKTKAAATGGVIEEDKENKVYPAQIVEDEKSEKGVITRGGKEVGGEITRGGQKVGGKIQRTLKVSKKKPLIPVESKDEHVQPGKSVRGGEESIIKLFGGSKKETNEKNGFKFLVDSSKVIKGIPFGIGSLMGAAVDAVLGYKSTSDVTSGISQGITYLINTVLSGFPIQSDVISAFGFSDGGEVDNVDSPTNFNSSIKQITPDVVSKVIGSSVRSKIDEIILSIEKENRKPDASNQSSSPSSSTPSTTSTDSSSPSGSSPDASPSTSGGPAAPPVTGKKADLWKQFKGYGAKAGAKYPQLVSAQFALESGWGTALSGTHNYFGIKAAPGESATQHKTREVYNGQSVNITAGFKNFNSPQDAVNHLVNQWYKDYKGYKGVNNAPSDQAAAQELRKQGYATDPNYSSSLIRLLKENASLAKGGAFSVLGSVGSAISNILPFNKKSSQKPSVTKPKSKLSANDLKIQRMKLADGLINISPVSTAGDNSDFSGIKDLAQVKYDQSKFSSRSGVSGLSGGGWIQGPMSGYPVSLDGGMTPSFIGHGLEWTGWNKDGGFVVPFDTPKTKSDPSLTHEKYTEAKKGGYPLPNFGSSFGAKNDKKTKNTPEKSPEKNINSINFKNVAFNTPQIINTPKINFDSKSTTSTNELSPMEQWAQANRKMIEKVGTKKQKEILSQLDEKLKVSKSFASPSIIDTSKITANTPSYSSVFSSSASSTQNVNPFSIPQLIDVKSDSKNKTSSTSASEKVSQSMLIWQNLMRSKKYNEASEMGKNIVDLKSDATSGKRKTTNSLMDQSMMKLQGGGSVQTSNSSPAAASKSDKITSALSIWGNLVNSKDYKSADEIGKNIWNLKYQDSLAKPKTPNPLMKEKKVNPFTIPQLIKTPDLSAGLPGSESKPEEKKKECKKLTAEMLTKKLQEVGLLETQASYEETGVKSMVFIQPMKQTVEVPSSGQSTFGF